MYDAEQDGLVAAHRVGIFDAATDRLVVSVKVRPGSSLDGAFRWASLETPARLKAGHAYLVASECVQGDALYDVPGLGQDWAPEIDYDRKSFASGVFGVPHGDNPWLCFWGPNFKFVAASAGDR